MLKRVLHHALVRAEHIADRLFQRTAEGREIDPYVGYATPTQIIVRGRVITKLRARIPVENQSRFRNLLDMVRLFLTDEVAGVTVKCGEVSAKTDEEGYFTLVLPRDARSGWDVEYVHVDGRTDAVACPIFIPRSDARYMVISDIDDTVLETDAYSLFRNLFTSLTGNSFTRHVYKDAIDLMESLSDNGRNPVFYVSSSPWNLHAFLVAIFVRSKLVRGPLFLRDLGLSETKFITEGHGNHKGGSIDHILRSNPDLPAVLLGDTGQHDAQIYRDVIERHPNRILAVGLRTPGPGMDVADQADLEALEATDVLVGAEPSFLHFKQRLLKRLDTYRV